jgi:hypothetical protein
MTHSVCGSIERLHLVDRDRSRTEISFEQKLEVKWIVINSLGGRSGADDRCLKWYCLLETFQVTSHPDGVSEVVET